MRFLKPINSGFGRRYDNQTLRKWGEIRYWIGDAPAITPSHTLDILHKAFEDYLTMPDNYFLPLGSGTELGLRERRCELLHLISHQILCIAQNVSGATESIWIAQQQKNILAEILQIYSQICRKKESLIIQLAAVLFLGVSGGILLYMGGGTNDHNGIIVLDVFGGILVSLAIIFLGYAYRSRLARQNLEQQIEAKISTIPVRSGYIAPMQEEHKPSLINLQVKEVLRLMVGVEEDSKVKPACTICLDGDEKSAENELLVAWTGDAKQTCLGSYFHYTCFNHYLTSTIGQQKIDPVNKQYYVLDKDGQVKLYSVTQTVRDFAQLREKYGFTFTPRATATPSPVSIEIVPP